MDSNQSYKVITNTIRRLGKPNERIKGDIDLDYGTLKNELGDSIGGLLVLLKSMQKLKLVDYNDRGMLQIGSIITLIGGGGTSEVISQQIPYEKIKDQITDADRSSHNRVGASTNK